MSSPSRQQSLDSPPKKKSLVSYVENRYFQYNLLLLVVTFIPILAVGFFNWLIDPYDAFDTPNFWGLNHEKTDKGNNDRLYKALDIIRIKPKVIIMGSSRTKQGLNPENPLFQDRQPVYNLAINGPNAYEVLRYVEHAIANQPDLEKIVLGVDFFMFNSQLENQPTFSEKRLEKQYMIPSDAVNALFSVDTLSASRDTLQESLATPPTVDKDNGFNPNPTANDGKTAWRFDQSLKLYFRLHSGYQLSSEYMSAFQKIVDLCRENNIDLVIFISPSHATQWEAIAQTGKWEVFEQWKRQIVQIAPVWDFSGYNSITTEPIADYMQNYSDNSHYTAAIGDLILEKIQGKSQNNIPADFGLLLSPENVDTHLAKIRFDQQLWRENNPDTVALVQRLYTEVQKELTTSNQRDP